MSVNGSVVTQRKEIPINVGLSRWRVLHAKIRGTTPLLMHNPAKMRDPKPATSRGTIPSPEEEARSSRYALEDGTLYLKADHVRESLKNAGKNSKIGKKTAVSLISAAVMENPNHTVFPLSFNGEPIVDYEIDVRRAVIQRAGIMRARPVIKDWEAEIVFDYDETLIDPAVIITFLGQAGQTVGLLDYRPAKGGSFGRFEILEAWEES